MTRFRVAVSAVVAAVSVLAGPSAASADSGDHGNNVVSVENDHDGALRARSRAMVAHAPGDSVANQNIASAYASCTDCRTVAAAVQVVIVEGDPSDFQPVNLAVALNENCLRCQTFAFARQVVLRSATGVRLSDEAEEQIERINGDIKAVTRSQRPFAEMTTDLDGLTERLATVVRGEIERAGGTAEENDHREVDEKGD